MFPRRTVVLVSIAASCPLFAQTTERLSVDLAGVEGDGPSTPVVMSRDGRFVAFTSEATNLVAGDGNGFADVFVRDRAAGTLVRASLDSAGQEVAAGAYVAGISADGNCVLFYTTGAFVPSDTNGQVDSYVRDLQAGTIERVSVTSSGAEAHGKSYARGISDNGRWVVFESAASDMVPNDLNGAVDVFVHDRQTGTTERVNVSVLGQECDQDCYGSRISADGRRVAFDTVGVGLVAFDTNGFNDVFVKDRLTGEVELASVDALGNQGDSDSFGAALSADGRKIAFLSAASNLVPGDSGTWLDVFWRDLDSGATKRVSLRPNGVEGDADCFAAAISPDGNFVAFTSLAMRLVSGDNNGVVDVFVRDVAADTTERASVDSSGNEADFDSFDVPAISLGGRYVAFASDADDLVANDGNFSTDVFLRDRVAFTPFASYCTAKLNSLGCLPAINGSGTPSASAGSGFTVSVSPVLNNKLGVGFYSKSGPASLAFRGGTLCVAAPFVRVAPPLVSGGNPTGNDCSGSFQFDFDAFVASGHDPALVAGQLVWLQVWSRDPGFGLPNNVSLSNGLMFELLP